MNYYFNIFLNVIYSCDGKSEFSAVINSVFSVPWSFRKRFRFWFYNEYKVQKNNIYIKLKYL